MTSKSGATTVPASKDYFDYSNPEYLENIQASKSSRGTGYKSGGGGGGAPEYTLRNPRLTPTAASIQRKSTVVNFPTRSAIKQMKDRNGYCSGVGDLLNYSAVRCIACVKEIAAACEKTQKPFFDKGFHYGLRDSMYPTGSPDDCTVTEPNAVERLSVLYPGAPLIAGDCSSNDITQGAVGDCFYIGAVSALACCTAQHYNPVGRLFVASNPKWGIYGVCFFKNGGWEWVVVDDFIAIDPSTKEPLYASSGGGEIWPMVMEKAYAKVHYAWDTIDGGWGREALGDMTGGMEYTLNLFKKDKNVTFEEFQKIVDNPLTILNCGVGQHVADASATGSAGEQGAVFGLFKGHCYSVIKSYKMKDGTGFLRIRNPWGNSAEWTGRYADNSKDWQKKPEYAKELKPEFKDDGAFWMCWEDFKQYLSDIDVCEYFTPDWNTMNFFGASQTNALVPSNTYILEVKGSPGTTTNVVVTVGQDDPKAGKDHAKAKSQPYATLRLSMYKLKSLPASYAELQGCLDRKMETALIYGRQVDNDLYLEPGFYSAVPMLRDCQPGVGHYIRVFTAPEVTANFFRMDDPKTVLTAGPKPIETVTTTTSTTTVATGNAARVVQSINAEKAVEESDGVINWASGIDKAGNAAFGLADPWNRGKIDRRMAEQAFGQLLLRSNLGTAFTSLLAKQESIDAKTFNQLFQDALDAAKL